MERPRLLKTKGAQSHRVSDILYIIFDITTDNNYISKTKQHYDLRIKHQIMEKIYTKINRLKFLTHFYGSAVLTTFYQQQNLVKMKMFL